MKSAPIPKNEAQRVESLRLYRILDTPAEESFDRITRIVAETIGVPIALISLVDEGRQWFKSKYGLEANETPREIAFCSHAILGDETFVIEDASQDDRFADNPLVTSDPNIRFYAGTPLKTAEGFNLGTLCAIDKAPRKLSKAHQQLLEDLARLVVDEMELRMAFHKALNQAAEELRLRTMHEDFIATINHELRTPLTSIRGTLGLLEGGAAGELTEEAKNMVAIANRNTMTLLALVNDLLDLQKLDAGKLDFDFNIVSIEDVSKKACDDMRGFALEKDVTINLECQNISNIVADPFRLQQALTNLISNAIKFSPDKGNVTIKTGVQESNVWIEVIDLGPGIPEHFQPYLFDRFSQADDLNKSTGTGLGLSITKAIVEAHRGSISFTTSSEQGTTFRISIPMQQTLVRSLA